MKQTNINLIIIICILIIQFFVLVSMDFRLIRIESKMEEYFAPINDLEFPEYSNH
jgi:hypothetical protein